MDGPLLKDIFVPFKGHPGIIGGDLCISGGHDLYGRRRAKLSREEKVLLAADSYKQEVARTSRIRIIWPDPDLHHITVPLWDHIKINQDYKNIIVFLKISHFFGLYI